jgi:hypothetical protein
MAASAGPTPQEILALDRRGADRLLDELEGSVRTHPPLLRLPSTAISEAIVFGDTHGDWHSSLEIAAGFLAGSMPRLLLGLGDYVDRAPPDSPNGSVANALYLLSLAARYPDRVVLLQGNHETSRRVPVAPHNLPHEVDELWGHDRDRGVRLASLLERGPLALTTANGAYLAHAGFPRRLPDGNWAAAFERGDEETLCEITWAECDASRNRRGAARPWGARDLDRFLAATGLRLMLRGHDPDVCGIPLYGDRCLTLQTTRVFERFGGVIVALLPLRATLESTKSLAVHHLATEGQRYPLPPRGGATGVGSPPP